MDEHVRASTRKQIASTIARGGGLLEKAHVDSCVMHFVSYADIRSRPGIRCRDWLRDTDGSIWIRGVGEWRERYGTWRAGSWVQCRLHYYAPPRRQRKRGLGS